MVKTMGMARSRRWMLVGIVAILVSMLALLVPQVAGAQTTGGGTGTLEAQGDGMAAIRGNATVTITGDGTLWIRDDAGDASINISGTGTRSERDNWVRYVGFDGSATVSGSDLLVALRGENIELDATGQGVYGLRGSGSYTAYGSNNNVLESGSWTEPGEIDSFGVSE